MQSTCGSANTRMLKYWTNNYHHLAMSTRLFTICFAFFLIPAIDFTQDSLPPVNRAILSCVKTTIGKKVGRGECWDLANLALNQAGANWDHKMTFGKQIMPDKSPVLPGDIIQFSGVRLKHIENGQVIIENMQHHTAVVYSVIEPGVYEMAQQNTGGRNGKKVSLTRLTLKYLIKGQIKFYRPQAI
jgi:hypothetical protein